MANPQQNYVQFMSQANLAAQQKLAKGYYQQLIRMYGVTVDYFRKNYEFFDPNGLLDSDGNVDWTYGYDSDYSYGNETEMIGYIEMGNDAFIFSMIGADAEQDGKIYFTKEQFELDMLDAVGVVTSGALSVASGSIALDNFIGTYTDDIEFGPFDMTLSADVDITPTFVTTYRDISDMTPDGVTLNTLDTDTFGIHFSADGTKLFTTGDFFDYVNEFALSTAWDLSTATLVQQGYKNVGEANNPSCVALSADGTKMFIGGSSYLNEYTLSTAWDTTTATLVDQYTTGLNFMYGIKFNEDGTKMYALNRTTDTIIQFDMPTPYDFTGMTVEYSFVPAVPAKGYDMLGFAIAPEGTKLYLSNTAEDEIEQYTLSTAWDLSTAVFDNVVYDHSGEASNVSGLWMGDLGRKFYLNYSNSTLRQYSTNIAEEDVASYVPDIDEYVAMTVTDIHTKVNEDINGYKEYVHNWVVQGTILGHLTGYLPESGDGTLSIQPAGTLTYNRPGTAAETNGWGIAPQVGDFIRITFGDGTTEDYTFTKVTDRDLQNDGISPFLGKFVWKCDFTRKNYSYETVPSGSITREKNENDYLNQVVTIQDDTSDTEYDYDVETEADDDVYGGF